MLSLNPRVSYSQVRLRTLSVVGDPERCGESLRDRKGEDSLYRLVNKDKSEAYDRVYRLENKNKKREYDRSYRLRIRNRSSGESNENYVERNIDRKREYDRQYNLLNKLKIRESKRRYRNLNEDKKREYDRQYRMKNEDKLKEYDRQYSADFKEKRELYRAQNKDKMNDYYGRNQDQLRQSGRENYLRHHTNLDAYLPRDSAAVNSWKSPDEVRDYFDSIAARLAISNHSDWYRVSREQIQELGGNFAISSKFDGLAGALQYAYPEIDWDAEKFMQRAKKSDQRRLKLKLQELLPGIEIVENYQHPELTWDFTSRAMELDLWIPKKKIGFEYQGEHHYYNLDGAFGPNGTASIYSERDSAKHSLCQSQGITLIRIPFWWDGELDSLSASLFHSCPDEFPFSGSTPIPTEMPRNIERE